MKKIGIILLLFYSMSCMEKQLEKNTSDLIGMHVKKIKVSKVSDLNNYWSIYLLINIKNNTSDTLYLNSKNSNNLVFTGFFNSDTLYFKNYLRTDYIQPKDSALIRLYNMSLYTDFNDVEFINEIKKMHIRLNNNFKVIPIIDINTELSILANDISIENAFHDYE